MNNWLSNNIITKTIDDREVKFRRVPVGTLQKFRIVGEEAAKALALLFKNDAHDVEFEDVKTPSQVSPSDGGAPYMSTVFKQQAAHPSVLSMRKLDMEDGIKGILNALMKDESMLVLCEVIAKSAWEEFNEEDIPQMAESLDAVTMIEFLKGAFEASAGDYAKLGKSWFQSNKTVQSALDKVAMPGSPEFEEAPAKTEE